MFYKNLLHYFLFFNFVIAPCYSADLRCKMIGAGITIIAEHPTQGAVVLMAKQIKALGGEFTNFGGFVSGNESPELAAARELEEESLSIYQISPSQFKEFPFYDSEIGASSCFRNYFIPAVYVEPEDFVRAFRQLHLDSNYSREAYLVCKKQILSSPQKTLPSHECKILKTLHDYLENNAFAWVPLELFINHLKTKRPINAETSLVAKQGINLEDYTTLPDLNGHELREAKDIKTHMPIRLRKPVAQAFSHPEIIKILESFSDQSIFKDKIARHPAICYDSINQ